MRGDYTKISMTIHDFGLTDVYTPVEFAEKIGVSVQSVNRWDRSKQVIANRIQRNNRTYKYYTQEQLDEFLKSDMYFNLNHVKNADLIHEWFGKLEVISFSKAAISKGYYGSYTCRCDCGNVVDLARSDLLSGKYKSCGCRFHDLTGLDFDRWHVDGIAPCYYTPSGSKIFQYYCTCKCGTKRVVTARALTSGASRSCGCLHKDIVSNLFLNDLTDEVFGDLTVVSRAENHWSQSGKSMRSVWNCRCKCGHTFKVFSEHLLSGRIDACDVCSDKQTKGASKYEFRVRQYLESIGLFEGESDGYIQYKTYPDLVGIGGGYLLYDFFVTMNDNSWLIECQGEQHYKPVDWYGGQAYFEKQQEHDRRKREYAKMINVPLIEIPFTCVSYADISSLLKNEGLL